MFFFLTTLIPHVVTAFYGTDAELEIYKVPPIVESWQPSDTVIFFCIREADYLAFVCRSLSKLWS